MLARARALLTYLMLMALMMGMSPRPAGATLTITITGGTEGAQPISIVPFGWQGAARGPTVRIAEIIADNLARTGRFEPIPFADLPSRPAEAAEVNFTDWRILGTANLVIGQVVSQAPGRFSVEFRLFDVFRAKQLAGFRLDTQGGEFRRLAHQISDIIYEELTGERGAFDTRIAYVTESGAKKRKRYALKVADSDGHNDFTILESTDPVLSPAWSPDGRQLAYVSFEGNRPRVFTQDLASGARKQLAGFPGINGAPAWSPDGQRVALSLSKDGNPEIYVVDVASGRLLRVTSSRGIDTEPAWSPDGKSLVFTSDRGGRPQIYRISLDGGRPERITFDGTYNARATYSPDGTKLALVHSAGGAFRIAVLDLHNNALRVLTETELDESPSFAPNGSMILYATIDNGESTLAAVSTDGRMRQQLALQRGKVREPSWSPFRER